MLFFHLITVIILAGAVLAIIFLIFRHLGEQERSLDTDMLHLGSLKDDLSRKDEEIKKVVVARDKLQEEIRLYKEEISKLGNEVNERDRSYQELVAKYAQLEKQSTEKGGLEAQLEQQKKQVVDQVIKYKKLENDFLAKQEEIATLEQRNKKLEQDIEIIKQELDEVKQKLAQERQKKEEEKEKVKEEISEEGQKLKEERVEGLTVEVKPEEPEPMEQQVDGPAAQPEEPKFAQPQEKLELKKPEQRPKTPKKKEKKEESPFNRFLKPKINEAGE